MKANGSFAFLRIHSSKKLFILIRSPRETTLCAQVTDATPEILPLMRKAGCWQITYGIESGSQRVLNFMRKDISPGIVREALKWARDAGIRTNGYFLFWFLTET